MKNYFRFILFPFAILYGFITGMRNLMYKVGWFKSTKFSIPIINVGNLSVGGTGKTPHIEYLIRLLKKEYNVATLSRGYGRKSVGFQLANELSDVNQIGDEPLQFYNKFNGEIEVAVDAKRVLGVIDLLHAKPKTNLILLDDAFQHRAILPGLNILLTTYNQPFFKDYILPVGNLREFRSGKSRADIVVISKCPEYNTIDKVQFIRQLNLDPEVKVFFSRVEYGAMKPIGETVAAFDKIILVTGIANPNPLENHLKKHFELKGHIKFRDHHKFSIKDIESIHNLFDKFADQNVALVTTEKDAMRLQQSEIKELVKDYPWYYKEIKVTLDDEEGFNKTILSYVQAINGSN